MSIFNRARAASAALAVLTAACIALAPLAAEARAGGGGSFGSRGSRTFQSAPSTRTAPTVAPIQRSQTTAPAQQPAQQPGMGAPMGQPRPGFAQRHPFMTGMLGGLVGAGLIGMLFGGGFGAFSGMAGFMGFLLQMALIAGIAWLVMAMFRRRREEGTAYAGGPAMARDAAPAAGYDAPRAGAGGGGSGADPFAKRDEIGLGPSDFEAFERQLAAIQEAWSRHDQPALDRLVTPEMSGYFAEQIEAQRARGVVNRVSDVRLLQGDLAEAWVEGANQYATVAMRWSAVDLTVDARSGRVVDGNAEVPVEAREVWTFMRTPAQASAADWRLAAIQQT